MTNPSPTKAALLSIGTELTRGELVNTNVCWLGERLTTLGFDVIEHVTVEDDRARIVAALLRLAENARVLISTGGLGPTTDDLTAEAVAQALSVRLVRHEPSLRDIEEKLSRFGRSVTPSNAKQADLPEGASVLPNTYGTAPGFGVRIREARVYFLPGVPREMKNMFETSVVPLITDLASRTSHQIHLRTFGLGESAIGEKLQGIEESEPRVILGYRAHFPEVEVKVLARGSSGEDAIAIATDAANQVRIRLGDIVYGGKEDTFAGVVGNLLRTSGKTLALAESCTGGLLGSMITDVPGASDFFLLDAVTYANPAKARVLGVAEDALSTHGAVSEPVARAMAEGVRQLADSDYGVSITGVAGPTGGTAEKPVGTVWIALSSRGNPSIAVKHQLAWDRERNRILASYLALRMLKQAAEA